MEFYKYKKRIILLPDYNCCCEWIFKWKLYRYCTSHTSNSCHLKEYNLNNVYNFQVLVGIFCLNFHYLPRLIVLQLYKIVVWCVLNSTQDLNKTLAHDKEVLKNQSAPFKLSTIRFNLLAIPIHQL